MSHNPSTLGVSIYEHVLTVQVQTPSQKIVVLKGHHESLGVTTHPNSPESGLTLLPRDLSVLLTERQGGGSEETEVQSIN